MTMGQILESVQTHPGCAVVITGGEPFLFPELPSLCLALREAGHAVHLETSGTLLQHIEADVLCISPKLSSSTPELAQYPEWHRQHEQSRLRPLVLRQFLETYGARVWFKFVVSSTADLAEINALMLDLSDLLPPDHVMLMPEGRTSDELCERALQVVGWCLQQGFRYSDRLHIRIWGNAPGK